MVTPVSLRLMFGGSLDYQDWEARHQAGQVPDRWPYGLDRLAEHGFRLSAAAPYQPGPRGRQIARAARALGHLEWLETRQKLRAAQDVDAVVCWDERVRRAGHHGRPTPGGDRRHRDEPTVRSPSGVPSPPRFAGPTGSGCFPRDSYPRFVISVWPQDRLRLLPFGIDADFFTPDDTPIGAWSGGQRRQRPPPRLPDRGAGDAPGPTTPAARPARTRHPPAHRHPPELGRRHPMLSHGDLRQLYRRSQVVVVGLRPNQHVSGVTVALEALACARPVVISDTPGMGEYVSPDTGIMVPPADHEAMAAAIIRLLRDADEATAMGSSGLKIVHERHTTAVMAQNLAELLRG